MAEPTKKSPQIDEFLKDVFGIDRINSVKAEVCCICKGNCQLSTFRDELSKKEFLISGMCQKCQDDTFREPNEIDLEDFLDEDTKAF
jgi:hypothetical protein